MIHHLSDVQSQQIGNGTNIWQYAVVLPGAIIGSDCNIGSHTFIEDDVVIGNNVVIKNGVCLWNGLTIGNNVFIGPCVVFTNDLYPRSKRHGKPVGTSVKHGATLGANSSILCGITIHEFAMIGMGAVVTRDVPAHALVTGNPARIVGWVDEEGGKLQKLDDNAWKSSTGILYYKTENGLRKQ